MANEEVSKRASEQAEGILKAKKMLETWASILDAALQEWFAAGVVNDRIRTAVASVKVAQVGTMLMAQFKDLGENLLESETELNAARRAVSLTHKMVSERINEALGFSSEPDSVELSSN